jgi:bifunctional lysine-specific demethylase and histidyl-hydroxylase NO66
VIEVRPAGALQRATGDAAAFLRESWGRRAVFAERADQRGYGDLLTFDDVDRMLSTMSLRTPTFRLVKAGEQIPESAYTRSGRTGSKPVSGMADPARMFELFRRGATIVLQGLHRYWEPVAVFVRELELELGHPCQVNAYLTPPGAQGLALHSDPHDVFVLQAFGGKHWQVHAAPGEEPRDPIEAVVATGDAIYMPAGTPHAASTQETLSGHLTVGVHVTTWRDVLADAWQRLASERALDAPVPAGWHRHLGAFADELRTRLDAVAGATSTLDPAAIAERRAEAFLTTRAPLVRGVLAEQLAAGAIDDETLVRRRRGSVCEIRRDAEGLTMLLGDRRVTVPGWLEPALRRIAETPSFAVGDLAAQVADAESRTVLVRRLVREGLLTLDRSAAEGNGASGER